MGTRDELMIVLQAKDEASAVIQDVRGELATLGTESTDTAAAVDGLTVASKREAESFEQVVRVTGKSRREYERLIPELYSTSGGLNAIDINLAKNINSLKLLALKWAALGTAVVGAGKVAVDAIFSIGEKNAALNLALANTSANIWRDMADRKIAQEERVAAREQELRDARYAAEAASADAVRAIVDRGAAQRESALEALAESVNPAVRQQLRDTIIRDFQVLNDDFWTEQQRADVASNPKAQAVLNGLADGIADNLNISLVDASKAVGDEGGLSKMLRVAMGSASEEAKKGVRTMAVDVGIHMTTFRDQVGLQSVEVGEAIKAPIMAANEAVLTDTTTMVDDVETALAKAPPAFREELGDILTFLREDWSEAEALIGDPFVKGMLAAWNAVTGTQPGQGGAVLSALKGMNGAMGGSAGSGGGSSGGSSSGSSGGFSSGSNFTEGSLFASADPSGGGFNGKSLGGGRAAGVQNYGTIQLVFPNVGGGGDALAMMGKLAGVHA